MGPKILTVEQFHNLGQLMVFHRAHFKVPYSSSCVSTTKML